jgi:hypothetical protein
LYYTVGNSASGGVLLPGFFAKLKIEGRASIDFSCSEKEVTALVAALKDAANEAARISQQKQRYSFVRGSVANGIRH